MPSDEKKTMTGIKSFDIVRAKDGKKIPEGRGGNTEEKQRLNCHPSPSPCL
jgi:hypothetical protein